MCQDSIMIIGQWKAISATMGPVYYNSTNDSSFLDYEFFKMKNLSSDTALHARIIVDLKRVILGTTFIFDNSGNFKQLLYGVTQIEGTYEIDEQTKKIKTSLRVEQGKPSIQESEYLISHSSLYINSSTTEQKLEFTLQKL